MSESWPGPSEEVLRAEVSATSRVLHARGWVANHDGNVSARLSTERFLCTPTATSKGDVTAAMLLVLDGEGKKVMGTRRPFSELHLHLAAYRARPDIGVVVHAHPPTATGFAVSRALIDPTIMAEPIVSLGRTIPLVPFFPPKARELDEALASALQQSDVVLLSSHGVLVVGGSCEQALLRLELVEHLARITLAAKSLGGPHALDPAVVDALSARGRPRSSPCFGELPDAPRPKSAPGVEGLRPDVQSLVQDALQRFQ
jgi:L-fuculose-phosphate aldolase